MMTMMYPSAGFVVVDPNSAFNLAKFAGLGCERAMLQQY